MSSQQCPTLNVVHHWSNVVSALSIIVRETSNYVDTRWCSQLLGCTLLTYMYIFCTRLYKLALISFQIAFTYVTLIIERKLE